MSRYNNCDSNHIETAVRNIRGRSSVYTTDCPHPTQKVFDWQALNELMYHEQKTSRKSNDELEDYLRKESPTQLSVNIDHYIDGHYI